MTSKRAYRWITGTGLSLLASACGEGDGSAPDPGPTAPQIVEISAGANLLAARVAIIANGLDSVRIRYRDSLDGERITPAHAESAREIIVAGLRANTSYHLVAEGWHRDQLLAGDSATFTTDSLPAALRTLTLELTSGTPGPGYTMLPVLLGTEGYLVAFDSTGTLRWYFSSSAYHPGAPADHHQLPNGHFLVYVGATRGFDPLFGQFYEIDLAGSVVRTIAAPPPFYTDNHDIIIDLVDSVPAVATFFSYDIRTTDLTAVGGAPGVALAGHQILRQRLDGGLDFYWNAWDQLSLLDWVEEPQNLKLGPAADFDHPNSIDRDAAGNYVVSWRSMGMITSIDPRSGAIRWRWGGRGNEFTFVGDSLGLFSGQHSVRVLANGNYLLYDNGIRHQPSETRIAEYRLDETARTATLVWDYHHSPAIFTPFVGSVTRLQSGNTFVGWGGVGVVQEVTPDKQTAWEARVLANGTPATFYRAFRVPDLYYYRRP